MKTIKMTKSDKVNGRLAGLQYEVSDKEADRYLSNGVAVEIRIQKPEQKWKKGAK